MHHLLAFNGTLAIGAAYSQVAGVPDGAIPRNAAGDYIIPANMRVLAHHIIGVSTSKGQIQAPSLRIIAYPELVPINYGVRTAVPDMDRVQTYGNNGPRVLMNETIGLYATNDGVGVSATSGALWVQDRFDPSPDGMTIPIVATVTITVVDGQWALGSLAFDTQLGAGQYIVTGMDVVGINALYARLVFPGNTGMRPGVAVNQINTRVVLRDPFRLGRIGSFGAFQFNVPPQLEIFGNAAGSTPFRVTLDVIKISG